MRSVLHRDTHQHAKRRMKGVADSFGGVAAREKREIVEPAC